MNNPLLFKYIILILSVKNFFLRKQEKFNIKNAYEKTVLFAGFFSPCIVV